MPSPSRSIAVLCPARTRTGGPEALHQLGRALIDLGHDARMVYSAGDLSPRREGDVLHFAPIDDPVPAAYARYAVPHTLTIEDRPGSIVVFPEFWPETSRLLQAAERVMWWLSIDNGLPALGRFGGFDPLRQIGCRHLAQSFYALAFLADRGISALPLFDYSSPGWLSPGGPPPASGAADPRDQGGRVGRVLFPARSAWFAGFLQRIAPDLDWKQLVGLQAEEVRDLFLTSKVYVDFGSHPGKDRMPREAAMLGCCVITGQRGAAGNPFDVPIPRDYKFRDSRRLNGRRIVKVIRATLAGFDERKAAFDTYRQLIAGEEAEFTSQVLRAFGRA